MFVLSFAALIHLTATLLKDIVTSTREDVLLERYRHANQAGSDVHESSGVRTTIASFASGHSSLEQMVQNSFSNLQRLFTSTPVYSDSLDSIANDMLQSHLIDAFAEFLSDAPACCLSLPTRRRLFRDVLLVHYDLRPAPITVLSKILSAITIARGGALSMKHSETKLHVSVKQLLASDPLASKRVRTFCNELHRCIISDHVGSTRRQTIASFLSQGMADDEPRVASQDRWRLEEEEHEGDDVPEDEQHDVRAGLQHDRNSDDDGHIPISDDHHGPHDPEVLDYIMQQYPEMLHDPHFIHMLDDPGFVRHIMQHRHSTHPTGASQINLVLWHAGASGSSIDGDALHGKTVRADATSAQGFRNICMAIDTGNAQFLVSGSRISGTRRRSEISDQELDKLPSAAAVPAVRKWLCMMSTPSAVPDIPQAAASVPVTDLAVEIVSGMTLQNCIDALFQRSHVAGNPPECAERAPGPRATHRYALVYGTSLGASSPPPPLPWTLEHVHEHLDGQLPRLHVIEHLASAERAHHALPPVIGLSPLQLCLALNREQILDWYRRMNLVTGSHAALISIAPSALGSARPESCTPSKCDRLIDILLQPFFSLSYLKGLFPRFNEDELCFFKDWRNLRTNFGCKPASEQHTRTDKLLLVKIHTSSTNKTQKSFDTMKNIFSKRHDLSALLSRQPQSEREGIGGRPSLVSNSYGQGATFTDVKLMVQYFILEDGREVTAFAADPDHDGITPTFFAALAQAFIEREPMWLSCCFLSSNQESQESPTETKGTAVSGGTPPRSRALKSVHERGLFPRPLLPNVSRTPVFEQNLLDDFRLFGFCVGIALRDHRKFPICISVAFADAICGKCLTLWDVMIGQFQFDSLVTPAQNQFEIIDYLSNGLKFGMNLDSDFCDDTRENFFDIPAISLLAPSLSSSSSELPEVQNVVPLHTLCPSSSRFEATHMTITAQGCLLHLSERDIAEFPGESKDSFLVAISGSNMPEGLAFVIAARHFCFLLFICFKFSFFVVVLLLTL